MVSSSPWRPGSCSFWEAEAPPVYGNQWHHFQNFYFQHWCKTFLICARIQSIRKCGFWTVAISTPPSAKTSVQAHAVFLPDFQHAGFYFHMPDFTSTCRFFSVAVSTCRIFFNMPDSAAPFFNMQFFIPSTCRFLSVAVSTCWIFFLFNMPDSAAPFFLYLQHAFFFCSNFNMPD